MVYSNLLKHSVIVAIDYWLAEWTSPKTNQSVSNGTSLADSVSSNTTLSEVQCDFMGFFNMCFWFWYFWIYSKYKKQQI